MPASATRPNSFGLTRRGSKGTTASDRTLLVQVLTADQIIPCLALDTIFFPAAPAAMLALGPQAAEAGVRIVPAGLDAEAPQQRAKASDREKRLVADQAISAEDRIVGAQGAVEIEPLARGFLAEQPARSLAKAPVGIAALAAGLGGNLLGDDVLRDDLEIAIAERVHQVEFGADLGKIGLARLDGEIFRPVREGAQPIEAQRIAALDVDFHVVRHPVRHYDVFHAQRFDLDALDPRAEPLVAFDPVRLGGSPDRVVEVAVERDAARLRPGRGVVGEALRDGGAMHRVGLDPDDAKPLAQIELGVLAEMHADIEDQVVAAHRRAIPFHQSASCLPVSLP